MTKIVLTNDDGIEEPGIRALHGACLEFATPIVVAPDSAYSGVGHAVTTRAPILVKTHAPSWYSVRGTPADCSRLSATRLAPDAEWLLAGINQGANLGVDVFTSGTVAAAREATFLGLRSIALSQYTRAGMDLNWEWTAAQVNRVLRYLMERPPEPGSFYNVNLPHLPPDAPPPELVECAVDSKPFDVRFRHEPTEDTHDDWMAHYEGVYAERPRTEGRDVDVCFSGRIAVSLIRLD